MKKITKLIAVLSLVAGVIMMSGCGLKEAIDATHNKWYKYNSAEGVNVDLGDDTSESSATVATLKGADFYLYFDDEKGLLVVVQKDKVETVDLAGGLLTTDITVTTGAQKQYTKQQFGSVQWGTLVASGKIIPSDTPKFISDHSHCIDVSEALGNGIQWKKVLRNILINQLLGEDI